MTTFYSVVTSLLCFNEDINREDYIELYDDFYDDSFIYFYHDLYNVLMMNLIYDDLILITNIDYQY